LVRQFERFATAAPEFEALDSIAGSLITVIPNLDDDQNETIADALTTVFAETKEAKAMSWNVARLPFQTGGQRGQNWMAQAGKLLSSVAPKGLAAAADILEAALTAQAPIDALHALASNCKHPIPQISASADTLARLAEKFLDLEDVRGQISHSQSSSSSHSCE
jgi:hypothetical protein